MKLVAISSGLVGLVLGAMTLGCGGGAASVAPASMPAGQPPAPQLQATSQDRMVIGSSCGESWRPEVQQWQSAVLTAIGRHDQYGLFDYVFIDREAYVGLRYGSLGLTDAELEAARRVEAQFAHSPVEARERGDLFLVRAWATPGAAVARAE
jgi:hypothetical protein